MEYQRPVIEQVTDVWSPVIGRPALATVATVASVAAAASVAVAAAATMQIMGSGPALSPTWQKPAAGGDTPSA